MASRSSRNRVAIYARVSTDRHRCRKCRTTFREGGNTQSTCPKCGSDDIDRGQNPETQLIPLREYAIHRRLVIREEYIDVGVSGAKDRRPGLDRLMYDARRGQFDVVLVARFDRFARSTKHLVLTLEEFEALGIDFISVSESVDTTTPMGKMIFTVIAAVAELERSLIRERVVMGLNRARKNGTRLGRPRVNVDATAVRRLRAEGRSWQNIVQTLGISRGSAQRAVTTGKAL